MTKMRLRRPDRAIRSDSPRVPRTTLRDRAPTALAMVALDPLYGAHFSRAGARVGSYFACGRNHRFFGQELHLPAPAAAAGERSRRAETSAVPFAKRRLDDAVLQRVKRDDRHPAAGTKRFITMLQELLELLQLTVDGDSERLENLRCRMVIAATPAFYLLNNFDKLFRRLQGALLSLGNDRLRDAPRLRLFAVIAKDSFQLIHRERIHHLLRVEGLAPIHAHIAPCIGAKAEASFRGINLMG